MVDILYLTIGSDVYWLDAPVAGHAIGSALTS